MNQKELMNQYVSDLAVLNVKFHNLHWNVVGPNFEQVHVYIEKLYDDLFIKYDEVAERLKMLGTFPLASLKSYLETTKVEELETKDFPVKEALSIVKLELNRLKTLSKEIRSIADQNDDFVTVGMMEDHIAGYDKEIWFVESALK
jgi:starvation-inducible DNA-binding protein